jgi:threonine dehydratase
VFAELSTAQARSESGQSPGTSPLSAADIDEVAARIARVVARTPLQFSERLSEVLVKLSDEQIAAGMVYSSAGDQAQGFAMACRSMGIHGRGYVQAKTVTGVPCPLVEVLHDRR